MTDYNITINNSVIDHNSCVVHAEQINTGSLEYDEILQELRKIQKCSEKIEPMIADKLSELQQAIIEQNKPKTSDIIRQLTTGAAASFLASVASRSLLAFLGLA